MSMDDEAEAKWIWWSFPQVRVLFMLLVTSVVVNFYQWQGIKSNRDNLLSSIESERITHSKENAKWIASMEVLRKQINEGDERIKDISQELQQALEEKFAAQKTVDELKVELAGRELATRYLNRESGADSSPPLAANVVPNVFVSYHRYGGGAGVSCGDSAYRALSLARLQQVAKHNKDIVHASYNGVRFLVACTTKEVGFLFLATGADMATVEYLGDDVGKKVTEILR